jgi:hypothetical protein
MVTIKTYDIVKMKTDNDPCIHGFVKRVSKNQSWCDVEWNDKRGHIWHKRMLCDKLDVIVTVPIGGGWTMTDCNRKAEIQKEMSI